MLPPSSTQNGDRGFTLIELLTVITIIAVLIGLLFPVAGAVMNNSRKTQAAAEETRIVNAVTAYQTEYGKLPLTSAQTTGDVANGSDTLYGNPGGSYPTYQLFNTLRAIPDSSGNNAPNPRQVVYFQGNNAKNPNDPRGGFLLTAHNGLQPGTLADPWGKEYVIFLDANGDSDLGLVVQKVYGSYPSNQGPQGTVQVADAGPDGVFGTSGAPKNSDDVITW